MKKVAVILGDKLSHKGELTFEFQKRLDKAIELYEKNEIDAILVTGSDTRKGFKTEAIVAQEYLKTKTTAGVILEDKARTTIENVLYSHLILEKENPEKIYIITSKKRMFRVKMLFKKLSSDIYKKCTFVSTEDHYFFYVLCIEIIYYILCFFDRKERTIASFTKKIFRNA